MGPPKHSHRLHWMAPYWSGIFALVSSQLALQASLTANLQRVCLVLHGHMEQCCCAEPCRGTLFYLMLAFWRNRLHGRLRLEVQWYALLSGQRVTTKQSLPFRAQKKAYAACVLAEVLVLESCDARCTQEPLYRMNLLPVIRLLQLTHGGFALMLCAHQEVAAQYLLR